MAIIGAVGGVGVGGVVQRRWGLRCWLRRCVWNDGVIFACSVCCGSELRTVELPDLLLVVRSAIGLTYVILLRLSGGVSPEGLKAFWRCRVFRLDDIHNVLCKCFDGCLEELCAQAALLDHLPWSCLDGSLVSLQDRLWEFQSMEGQMWVLSSNVCLVGSTGATRGHGCRCACPGVGGDLASSMYAYIFTLASRNSKRT